MTLAMIVRADRGGLAEQTLAISDRMQPDVQVLVDMEGARGRTRYERVPDAIINKGPRLSVQSVRALLNCDIVYTVEGWYWSEIPNLAQTAIRHVNPELFDGCGARETLLAPTDWERHRLPPHQIVPLPVDQMVHSHTYCTRERDSNFRLLHVTGPAMLDRNGTEIVYAALKHCHSEFTLVVHAHDYENEVRRALSCSKPPWVEIEVRDAHSPEFDDVSEMYMDVDALVLPRRYAGLCMPIQEAAAHHLPIITTSNTVYAKVLQPELIVPAEPASSTRMKGGTFAVYTCEDKKLAAVMDGLIGSRDVRLDAIDKSVAFAECISWDVWEETYCQILRP